MARAKGHIPYRLAMLSCVLAASIFPPAADAQPLEHAAVSAAAGRALRSAGEVGECCGPFRSRLEQSRGLWVSGAAFRRVAPRFGFDVEASWNREPLYTAYFQGRLDGHPLRGYRAENRVSATTVAALVRLRSWHSDRSAVDVVAGLGWTREARSSQLESVLFRFPQGPVPTIVLSTENARALVPFVLGVDLVTGGRDVSFVAAVRLHALAGGRDSVRSDLELGREVLRVGLGARNRF